MQLLQWILGYIFSATQLSQSAYTPLQLPYAVFGLGQTPNFVDKIEAGIPNPPGTVSMSKFVKWNLIKDVRSTSFKRKCMSLYNLKLHVLFLDLTLIASKLISMIFFPGYTPKVLVFHYSKFSADCYSISQWWSKQVL